MVGQTNDPQKKRQPSKGKSERAPRFNSARFVNYELDTAQQAACKGWDISPDGVWQEMQNLVDEGYSISIKFDTFSESYACFVRAGDSDDAPNRGFILAGRGSSCWKAAKQCLFKHAEIGADWGEYAEKRTAVMDD